MSGTFLHVRRRAACALCIALVACCLLGEAGVGIDDNGRPTSGLVPTGVVVRARMRPFAPTFRLTGRVDCLRTEEVLSHYRWWTEIAWMAPEGERVEEGQTVAVVYHEEAEQIAARERRAARRMAAEARARQEREKLHALEGLRSVWETEDGLREAETELANLEQGPLPEELRIAELAAKKARLRLATARKACESVERTGSDGAVSEERRGELEYERAIADCELRAAEAELRELRSGPSRLALLAARAKVAAAEAALSSAERGVESARHVEAAETARLLAEASQAAAVAENWDDRLRTMERTAGLSGLIVWREHPGTASLWPGPIATILDPHSMVFVARATEREVPKISKGLSCEVRLPALANEPLPGTVMAVAVSGDDVGVTFEYGYDEDWEFLHRQVYDVIVQLEAGKELVLLPGMSGQAVIQTGEQVEALVVPRACVRLEDGRAVALVRDGDAWQPRELSLGGEDERSVVVTAGLHPGEEVAVLAE